MTELIRYKVTRKHPEGQHRYIAVQRKIAHEVESYHYFARYLVADPQDITERIEVYYEDSDILLACYEFDDVFAQG